MHIFFICLNSVDFFSQEKDCVHAHTHIHTRTYTELDLYTAVFTTLVQYNMFCQPLENIV